MAGSIIARALEEATDDLILISDWQTARFVEANRCALTRLGYSIEELRSMTGGDLSELPREAHRQVSGDLIERGDARVGNVPVRCKDGSVLRVDLRVKRFSFHGTDYHLTVLREVFAKVDPDPYGMDRERLLESEAFYRGVVTCTEDAVVVSDLRTGAIVEANPAACTLFGFSTVEFAELRPTLWHDDFGADRRTRQEEELRESGRSKIVDARLARKDKTSFWGDVMQNVFDSGGRKLLISVIRDVSTRHRQREQFERAQRLAAIGEIAAGVAHEINNPAAFVWMNGDALGRELATLSTKLQTLRDTTRASSTMELVDELVEHVTSARDIASDNQVGVERIRSVTRDLRLFSRVDDGDMQEVDLNDVVRRTVKFLRNELRHRARVSLDLVDDLPLLVAQAGKLAQVLTNLLTNAAQAIVEGAADANEIRIATVFDEEHVVLLVQDTGSGMDEETANRVFEPFFTTKTSDNGTGLGLALCVDIISKHRGEIRVESTPGIGSSFEVKLLRNSGLSPAQPVVDESSGVRPTSKRILVIDDDPGMVRAYRRAFSIHAVEVVSRGADAVTLLVEGQQFDLIVCDLMMPEMDGPEVHAAIAERAPEMLSRMVFCTGGAFTTRVRDFLARVDTPVVDKPLTADVLDRLLTPATRRAP